jgi:uncharacterized membrane-anchored protein
MVTTGINFLLLLNCITDIQTFLYGKQRYAMRGLVTCLLTNLPTGHYLYLSMSFLMENIGGT